MIPPEELTEARVVTDAASPQPWRNGADPSHFGAPEVTDDRTFAYYVTKDEDAKFIALARSLVPRLLDDVERATRERDNWRSLAVQYARAADSEKADRVQTRALLDEARVETAKARERYQDLSDSFPYGDD